MKSKFPNYFFFHLLHLWKKLNVAHADRADARETTIVIGYNGKNRLSGKCVGFGWSWNNIACAEIYLPLKEANKSLASIHTYTMRVLVWVRYRLCLCSRIFGSFRHFFTHSGWKLRTEPKEKSPWMVALVHLLICSYIFRSPIGKSFMCSGYNRNGWRWTHEFEAENCANVFQKMAANNAISSTLDNIAQCYPLKHGSEPTNIANVLESDSFCFAFRIWKKEVVVHVEL